MTKLIIYFLDYRYFFNLQNIFIIQNWNIYKVHRPQFNLAHIEYFLLAAALYEKFRNFRVHFHITFLWHPGDHYRSKSRTQFPKAYAKQQNTHN